MGGYGSTRWGSHSKRDTVGDGLVLSMRPLLKLIKEGREWPGLVTWSRGEEKRAEISVALEPGDGWTFLRFKYTAGRGENKRDVSYLVEIVSVPTPKGGLKWYFLCPGHSGTCRRRCSKLYTAPGSSVFACRECHNLTYTTSQESHKFDSIYKHLAQDMGGQFTARDIERTLRRIK
jgi:hypothetical protein